MTRKAKAKVDVKVDKRIDSEELRKQAAALGALVATQAEEARKNASVLAAQGREWAGPRAEHLIKDAVKATAPKIELAAEKVAPAVDTARDKLVDDYLPRISKAMHDAAEAAAAETNAKGKKAAAKAAKAAAAGKAAQKALSKAEPEKSGGGAKTLGWVVVGVAAAGAGYLLWRRSQPVDDPWAEEYWDDTTVTSPGATTDSGAGSSTLDDAATRAGQQASGLAESAADAIRTGTHRAEGAADDVASSLEEAGEAAEEKGKETGR